MWRFTSSGPGPSLSTLHPAHPCPRAPKSPAFSHSSSGSQSPLAGAALPISEPGRTASSTACAGGDRPMRHREAISTMHRRLSVPRGGCSARCCSSSTTKCQVIRFGLVSAKSLRYVKPIGKSRKRDIRKFESCRPSHAVGSLWVISGLQKKRGAGAHGWRIGQRDRESRGIGIGSDVMSAARVPAPP